MPEKKLEKWGDLDLYFTMGTGLMVGLSSFTKQITYAFFQCTLKNIVVFYDN